MVVSICVVVQYLVPGPRVLVEQAPTSSVDKKLPPQLRSAIDDIKEDFEKKLEDMELKFEAALPSPKKAQKAKKAKIAAPVHALHQNSISPLPTAAIMASLENENRELFAWNAALQHQMLQSCVAKNAGKLSGAQTSLPQLKLMCASKVFSGVNQQLSSAVSPAPTLGFQRKAIHFSSLHSNSSITWRPKDYHLIGHHEHEYNFTHFVRQNIIRQNMPVRANPFDDPVPFDPSVLPLKKAGIRVDSSSDYEPIAHDWGRDGKDHYNASAHVVPRFQYAKAKRPYWAFLNHALKSQPAFRDPEGKANLRLMLGSITPELDDYFKNATVPPPTPHEAAAVQDRFADWKPGSQLNQHLLFGDSSFFNGEIPEHGSAPGLFASILNPSMGNSSNATKANKTVEHPDKWALFDDIVNVSQGFDRVSEYYDIPVRDVHLPRTGQEWKHPEDLIDVGGVLDQAIVPRQGHMGPLLVNAATRRVFEGDNATWESPGRKKLEKAGINVDGLSIG